MPRAHIIQNSQRNHQFLVVILVILHHWSFENNFQKCHRSCSHLFCYHYSNGLNQGIVLIQHTALEVLASDTVLIADIVNVVTVSMRI